MKITTILLPVLLIIVILILFLLLFLNGPETEVQKYLNTIYNNGLILERRFTDLINKESHAEEANGVIVFKDFLNKPFFNYLKTHFQEKEFQSMNVGDRKGTGVHFFDLHKNNDYLGIPELYYSNQLTKKISDVLKKPIQRTPLSDKNAESLIIYVDNGDFINWHKDGSNYYGDRYVGLITLINENAEKNGLSHASFMYKNDEKEISVQLPENSFILFKGSEILHKATPIQKNERRILISMVFCDICQTKNDIYTGIYEKVKNTIMYNSK